MITNPAVILTGISLVLGIIGLVKPSTLSTTIAVVLLGVAVLILALKS